MGGGSSVISQPFSVKSVNENVNPQDEAAIHRGKIGALKLVINTDGTRNALMKFLRKIGRDLLLDYYFEIEDIKIASEDIFYQQAVALIDRYNPNKATKQSESLKIIWESIQCTNINSLIVNERENVRGMKAAFRMTQEEVLSSLSLHLDAYLNSSFHKEWEKDRKKLEHQSFVKSKSGKSLIASEDYIPSCADNFKNVLLVDDSTICSKITTNSLKKNGHHVEHANNGRSALEKLNTQNYDIVLIDLHMPIMDGFEAVRIFRKHQLECSMRNNSEDISDNFFPAFIGEDVSNQSFIRRDPIIIIGISSDSNEATRRKAVEAGVDYFMSKPFTLQKFLEAVNQGSCH
jgi:CheY-like chemotaxis protein